MNEIIKKKSLVKKHACNSFNANNKNYDIYLKLQIKLEIKEGYYRMLSYKLNDLHTSTKSYWPILKTFKMEKNSINISHLDQQQGYIKLYRESKLF